LCWRGVGGLGLPALLAVVAWLGVLLVVVRGAVSVEILRLRSRMGLCGCGWRVGARFAQDDTVGGWWWVAVIFAALRLCAIGFCPAGGSLRWAPAGGWLLVIGCWLLGGRAVVGTDRRAVRGGGEVVLGGASGEVRWHSWARAGRGPAPTVGLVAFPGPGRVGDPPQRRGVGGVAGASGGWKARDLPGFGNLVGLGRRRRAVRRVAWWLRMAPAGAEVAPSTWARHGPGRRFPNRNTSGPVTPFVRSHADASHRRCCSLAGQAGGCPPRAGGAHVDPRGRARCAGDPGWWRASRAVTSRAAGVDAPSGDPERGSARGGSGGAMML
jgi:hypothetical protein